jgi:hypothetical protein
VKTKVMLKDVAPRMKERWEQKDATFEWISSKSDIQWKPLITFTSNSF